MFLLFGFSVLSFPSVLWIVEAAFSFHPLSLSGWTAIFHTAQASGFF